MRKFLLIPIFVLLLSGIGLGIRSSPVGWFSLEPDKLNINWNTDYNGTLKYDNDTLDISTFVLQSNIKNSMNYQISATNIKLSHHPEKNILNVSINKENLGPGYYNGTITLESNYDNSKDSLTLPVNVSIPISNLADGSETFSGKVSSDRPEIYYFDASKFESSAGLEIEFNEKSGEQMALELFDDTLKSLKKQTLYLNSTNKKFEYKIENSNQFPLTSYWHFVISTAETESIQFDGTLTLKKANFLVNDQIKSGTLKIKENIGIERTSTNPRGIGFTITNYQDTNLDILHPLPSSGGLNNENYYVNYTDLNPTLHIGKGNNQINFKLLVNQFHTNNQKGIYSGQILITTNGYPYNNFTLNLEVELTDKLNVNITNATAFANPGENIYIELEPKYQNSSNVFGLIQANSNFLVTLNHIQLDYSRELTINSVTNNYKLNATLPSDILGGNYTINVFVNDGKGNKGANSTQITINQIALKLVLMNENNEISKVSSIVGNTFRIYPKIKNYGAKDFTGAISITQAINSDCLSLQNTQENITIININKWNEQKSENYWEYKAEKAVSCSLTFTLTDSTNSNTWVDNTNTKNLEVSIASSSGSSTTPSTPSVNAYVSQHKLEITDYPKEIQIEQETIQSIKVKVKNTGDFSEKNITIEISDLENKFWSSPDRIDLSNSKDYTFVIYFDITNDISVGSYPIKIRAVSIDTSADINSVLKIKPGEATIKKIKEQADDYEKLYTSLSQEIQNIKNAGINISETELNLKKARELLDTAKEQISAENWNNAYFSLKEAESLLSAADQSIKSVKNENLMIGNLAINVQGLTGLLTYGASSIFILIIMAFVYFQYIAKPSYVYKKHSHSKLEELKFKFKTLVNNIKEKIENMKMKSKYRKP